MTSPAMQAFEYSEGGNQVTTLTADYTLDSPNVGDLLICWFNHKGGSGPLLNSVPTGWIEVHYRRGGSDFCHIYTYVKIAESGDDTTHDFGFSGSGDGTLAAKRITGDHPTGAPFSETPTEDQFNSTTTRAPDTSGSLTSPSYSNSDNLLIGVVGTSGASSLHNIFDDNGDDGIGQNSGSGRACDISQTGGSGGSSGHAGLAVAWFERDGDDTDHDQHWEWTSGRRNGFYLHDIPAVAAAAASLPPVRTGMKRALAVR